MILINIDDGEEDTDSLEEQCHDESICVRQKLKKGPRCRSLLSFGAGVARQGPGLGFLDFYERLKNRFDDGLIRLS